MRWSSGFLLFALAILTTPTFQAQCPCGASQFYFNGKGTVVYFIRGVCSAQLVTTDLVGNSRGESNDNYCYGTIIYKDCGTHGCLVNKVKESAYQIEVKYNDVNEVDVQHFITRNKPNEVKLKTDYVSILFRCSPTGNNCKDYYGADLSAALNKDGIHDGLGNVLAVPDNHKEHLPKASELLKSIASEMPPPRSMRFDADYLDFPMFRTSTTTTTSTTSMPKRTEGTSLLPQKPRESKCPNEAVAGGQNQAASGSTKTEGECSSCTVWIVVAVISLLVAAVEGVALFWCWKKQKKVNKRRPKIDGPRRNTLTSVTSSAMEEGVQPVPPKDSKQAPSRVRTSSSGSQGNDDVSHVSDNEIKGGGPKTGGARAGSMPNGAVTPTKEPRPGTADGPAPASADVAPQAPQENFVSESLIEHTASNFEGTGEELNSLQRQSDNNQPPPNEPAADDVPPGYEDRHKKKKESKNSKDSKNNRNKDKKTVTIVSPHTRDQTYVAFQKKV